MASRGSLENPIISDFKCEWRPLKDMQVPVCHQNGKIPPQIDASVIRELRRLGLPADQDAQTFFAVWKPKASGWVLAEAFYRRFDPESDTMAFCQVIVMIAQSSRVFVLRELPFQNTDADVPTVTTWSLRDVADVDGDGLPDVVMEGDAYEDHWFEVYSVQNGSPRLIFSGLGYYL